MWSSSIISTLEVELVGEIGRGEWIGEYDGGDIEGVRGGVSGRTRSVSTE